MITVDGELSVYDKPDSAIRVNVGEEEFKVVTSNGLLG